MVQIAREVVSDLNFGCCSKQLKANKCWDILKKLNFDYGEMMQNLYIFLYNVPLDSQPRGWFKSA